LKSVQGDDLQLNVANKLYPQSGYSIKQEFVDILKQDSIKQDICR
jgi:hypothetical protein